MRIVRSILVLDVGAEAGECIRLEIDVTKLDCANAGCPHKAAALPVDTWATDWVFGVVPDG
jgi:hypothetical protein